MIQTELINNVARDLSLEKATTERVLKAFVCEIIAGLAAKRSATVKLKGFGAFSVRKRKSRRGWNPAAKRMEDFPASYAIKFRASSNLDIADAESVKNALAKLSPHPLRRLRPKQQVRAKQKPLPKP